MIELISERVGKCRKPRRCGHCLKTIQRGEPLRSQFIRDSGHAWTWTEHADCGYAAVYLNGEHAQCAADYEECTPLHELRDNEPEETALDLHARFPAVYGRLFASPWRWWRLDQPKSGGTWLSWRANGLHVDRGKWGL